MEADTTSQRKRLHKSKSTPSAAPTDRNAQCLRREDFEFGALLGEGAFARVRSARDVRDGSEYAVKIIDKKMIQVQDRRHGVMTERRMLLSLDHPGIVRLHFAFQDDWSLYFCLELVSGGELAKQVERMGVCSRDFTRFYAAEIVSILAYLRVRCVAHRDLKPENLLISSEGHLKLVDFDAAVIVPGEGEGDAAGGRSQGGQPQAPSFAGTALYLPPEVIMGTAQPHQAFALDIWALGCIIFLMLVGKTPFHAESEYLVFQRIQRGDFAFPAGFLYEEAQRLTEALLSSEPSRRPGLGAEGLNELQRHAFFGGSAASFCELRRQRPPPRVSRSHGDPLSSPEQSMPFDFSSSYEMTPEEGGRFLSRRTQVVYSGGTTSEPEPPPYSLSTTSAPSTPNVNRSGRHEADSPQFRMSVECRLPRVSLQAPGDQRGLAYRQPSPTLSKAMPNSLDHSWRQSSSSTAPSAAPGDAASSKDVLSRQLVASQGFIHCQWLEELSQRQVLLRGEGICIFGRVVRRRFPCLRPKVLILTDLPRLLVMDPSGRRLLQDIDLGAATPGSVCGTTEDSLYKPVLQVHSRTEFEICFPGQHLWCRDTELGSEEWSEKIIAARQQVLLSRQSNGSSRADSSTVA